MLSFCKTYMSLVKSVFLYLQCLFDVINRFFVSVLVEMYSPDAAKLLHNQSDECMENNIKYAYEHPS
jgi:hypothetical protein